MLVQLKIYMHLKNPAKMMHNYKKSGETKQVTLASSSIIPQQVSTIAGAAERSDAIYTNLVAPAIV